MDNRAHAATFTKVMEVAREAIAYIDHGRGQPVIREKAPYRATGLRPEVPLNHRGDVLIQP